MNLNEYFANSEQHLVRHGPLFLVGLGAVLLAVELFSFARGFMPAVEPAASVADPAMSPGPVLPVESVNQAAENIAAHHLFGANTDGGLNLLSAPETRLNLILLGILAEAEGGAAIIADNGQPGRYFAVGEDIPGAGRLHEVYPDRVILDRSGRYEALYLPKEADGMNAMGAMGQLNQLNQVPIGAANY